MITLCGFSVSNYYNKVKLALLEKGIPFKEELVMTGSKEDTVLNATPLGKVPFLRTEQGTLCESQVIVDYLEAAYPAVPLLPVHAVKATIDDESSEDDDDEVDDDDEGDEHFFHCTAIADGSAATLSFLTSPEIVTALAFAGTLEFDPVHGTIPGPDGKTVPGVRGIGAMRGPRCSPPSHTIMIESTHKYISRRPYR